VNIKDSIMEVKQAVKNSTQEEHQAYLKLLTTYNKNKFLSEKEIKHVFRNEFYEMGTKKYFKYS